MCENMAECVKLISLSVPVTGGEGRRVVTPVERVSWLLLSQATQTGVWTNQRPAL